MATHTVARHESYSDKDGVLLHFFGTDLYARTETSNLKSFESVFSTQAVSRFKKDGLLFRFGKLAFYHYRLLAAKEVEVDGDNYSHCLRRLVVVEESQRQSRRFGIFLNK